MIRLLKWTAMGFALLSASVIVIAAVTVVVAGVLYDLRSPARTAGGLRQDTAQYIQMSDGVRIAVDVFLPPSLKAGQEIPVLIKATPYWRAYRLGFLGKALVDVVQAIIT